MAEISRRDQVIEFAGKRRLDAGFPAICDFGFGRIVIPWGPRFGTRGHDGEVIHAGRAQELAADEQRMRALAGAHAEAPVEAP